MRSLVRPGAAMHIFDMRTGQTVTIEIEPRTPPSAHDVPLHRSEPPLDEIAREQAEQAKDDQHQPPGGAPVGSVIVTGLPWAFVLLHEPMVSGGPHEVNGTCGAAQAPAVSALAGAGGRLCGASPINRGVPYNHLSRHPHPDHRLPV